MPNKGAHDYSAAQKFGDLIFLTEGTINKFALDVFYRTAAEAMYDAEASDYVVITSLNSICSICSAIMARRFGRVNFLLFRRDRYVERQIHVDSLLPTLPKGGEDCDYTITPDVPVTEDVLDATSSATNLPGPPEE